jgi:hypothetical protein
VPPVRCRKATKEAHRMTDTVYKIIPYDEASIDILDDDDQLICLKCKYIEPVADDDGFVYDNLCSLYGERKPKDAGCNRDE